jgi:hypothetical protein
MLTFSCSTAVAFGEAHETGYNQLQGEGQELFSVRLLNLRISSRGDFF